MPYEWVEQAQERHTVVDALVCLADLTTASGDIDTARLALEQAIEVGPLVEDVYRRLMRLHLDGGDHTAARRVFRHLCTELATIDAEPDEATSALAHLAARRDAGLAHGAAVGA